MMVSKDMSITVPAGDAGGEQNGGRNFWRRRFLFGLFAAPLVPVAAKAAEGDATSALDQLLSASPTPWRGRIYGREQLLELLGGAPPAVSVDVPDAQLSEWEKAWLKVARRFPAGARPRSEGPDERRLAISPSPTGEPRR